MNQVQQDTMLLHIPVHISKQNEIMGSERLIDGNYRVCRCGLLRSTYKGQEQQQCNVEADHLLPPYIVVLFNLPIAGSSRVEHPPARCPTAYSVCPPCSGPAIHRLRCPTAGTRVCRAASHPARRTECIYSAPTH